MIQAGREAISTAGRPHKTSRFLVQSAPSPVTKLAAIGLKGRQYRRDVFLISTPAAHRAAIDRPGDILVGRRIKLFGPALFVKSRLVSMPEQPEELRFDAIQERSRLV